MSAHERHVRAELTTQARAVFWREVVEAWHEGQPCRVVLEAAGRFLLALAMAVVVGCGTRPAPIAPVVVTSPPARSANPLCDDSRLPPRSCLHQNRPAPIDWDGTCPQCAYAYRTLPDGGISYTLRGAAPFVGKNEIDFDLLRPVPDRPQGLVGFVTHYDRIEVSGLHGNATVSPSLWFRAKGDTRKCATRHRWLAVMLPPMKPIVTPPSKDVVFRSNTSETCGGMYVFNATGPTVHWKQGEPLDIDWGRLLTVATARGWSPTYKPAEVYAMTSFAAEIAGYTPRGKLSRDGRTLSGGATVRLWGWREL